MQFFSQANIEIHILLCYLSNNLRGMLALIFISAITDSALQPDCGDMAWICQWSILTYRFTFFKPKPPKGGTTNCTRRQQTVSRIKILPEVLSNQIAAGEVVERPASVVKELVENSLDAGATRIMIEVEGGGRSLIRVSDDGIGMAHDDALLSIERYGTSKIYDEPDLFSIKTLGFRGEALPSIASISRFTLETKEEDSPAGTRIFMEGGRIKKVSEVGAPTGTQITVEKIFFNTPARRKFLKTTPTEMGHVADTVASIASGWPDVLFRLFHNGKRIKHWSPVSDPLDRVADVLGKHMRNDLHRLESDDGTLSISGWIASPRITRATSRGIHVYVNGRHVRDKIIQHALFDGCAGRLMKGQFPMAVLFVNLPPDQVDVNVHPKKSEVRFFQQNRVHDSVATAVSMALTLADGKAFPSSTPSRTGENLNGSPEPPAGFAHPAGSEERGEPYVSEPSPHFNLTHSQVSAPVGFVNPAGGQEEHPATQSKDDHSIPYDPSPDRIPEPYDPSSPDRIPECLHLERPENWRVPRKPSDGNGAPKRMQGRLWEKRPFTDLRIIGQLHDAYILCESEEGLVMIDQHAAHERILFEQLKHRFSDSEKISQELLIPETLDLGYTEAGILEKLIPDLKEAGLEIEPFGRNTFVVKAVPAILGEGEISPLITEIVEKTAEIGRSSGIEEATDASLATMACHAAIRAKQSLSHDQMKLLLNQLEACDNPSHCPHGRPVWIRWPAQFLEKSFKRVV